MNGASVRWARSDGNCRCCQDRGHDGGALGNDAKLMNENSTDVGFNNHLGKHVFKAKMGNFLLPSIESKEKEIYKRYRLHTPHISNLVFPVTSLLCSKFPKKLESKALPDCLSKYYGFGLVLVHEASTSWNVCVLLFTLHIDLHACSDIPGCKSDLKLSPSFRSLDFRPLPRLKKMLFRTFGWIFYISSDMKGWNFIDFVSLCRFLCHLTVALLSLLEFVGCFLSRLWGANMGHEFEVEHE